MNEKSDSRLISVIVTAFNVAPYIEEALASVLSQSYTNFECIVINDCSTDGTLDVLTRLVRADSRVKVFSTPENSGPWGARNFALEKAVGDYVSFLDGDDIWDQNFLTEMSKALDAQSSNTVACFCWSSHMNEKSLPLERKNKPGLRSYGLYEFLRDLCPPGNGSCLIIRRSELVHHRFKNIIGEDSIMWLELLSKGSQRRFYCLPLLLVRYRVREGSETRLYPMSQRVSSYDYRLKNFLPLIDEKKRPTVLIIYIKMLLKSPNEEAVGKIKEWMDMVAQHVSLRFLFTRKGLYYLMLRLCGPVRLKKVFDRIR